MKCRNVTQTSIAVSQKQRGRLQSLVLSSQPSVAQMCCVYTDLKKRQMSQKYVKAANLHTEEVGAREINGLSNWWSTNYLAVC